MGPAALCRGPHYLSLKCGDNMRYRTHTGQYKNAHCDRLLNREFVEAPRNLYINGNDRERFQAVAATVDVPFVKDYLENAIMRGACVMALRDDITLLIHCNKLDFTVDFETLQILGVRVHMKGEL